MGEPVAVDIPMRFPGPLVWTVDDVFSPRECRDFITAIEAASPALATNNPVYRDQDRVIRDDPQTSTTLFERLRAHLPTTLGPLRLVGLNERLRLYRYGPGQRFAPHMDHWYKASDHVVTLLTVLVYFNDDFEGGETRFMEQLDRVVVPAPGRVAIFQHKVRHEGCPVIAGRKYALRTDALYEADGPLGILGVDA